MHTTQYTTVHNLGRIKPKVRRNNLHGHAFNVLELTHDGGDIAFFDLAPEEIVRLGQEIEKAGRDLCVELAHEQNHPAEKLPDGTVECQKCAALAVADPFA